MIFMCPTCKNEGHIIRPEDKRTFRCLPCGSLFNMEAINDMERPKRQALKQKAVRIIDTLPQRPTPTVAEVKAKAREIIRDRRTVVSRYAEKTINSNDVYRLREEAVA